MATIKSIFGISTLRVAKAFPSLDNNIRIPKGTVTNFSKEVKDTFAHSKLKTNNKSRFNGYVEHNTRANLLKQKNN